MTPKNSLRESILLWFVKAIGFVVRALPLFVALALGRWCGRIFYFLSSRKRGQVYLNLKTAFAGQKDFKEIQRISRRTFVHFGQNIIEVLRLPSFDKQKFLKHVSVEAPEHITYCLKAGQGVLLLVMHFGSWEMANLACAALKFPYRVLVNTQKRHSKLNDLLNAYRAASGGVMASGGLGPRELIRSLRRNEAIGIICDQGGKDGELVPLFGKTASLSSGAIRLSLKYGTPICFSVIYRKPDGGHHLRIHEPWTVPNTGHQDVDIRLGMTKIGAFMETYIREYPHEYLWFYKVWKYTDESMALILSDGKAGHVHQSKTVLHLLTQSLAHKNGSVNGEIKDVCFRSSVHEFLLNVLTLGVGDFLKPGCGKGLRFFLTPQSFAALMSLKVDHIISCGSKTAAVSVWLTKDNAAKNCHILKPAFLPWRFFSLGFLPAHDVSSSLPKNVTVTQAAPNLITKEFMETQSRALRERFPELRHRSRLRVGVLVGGDTKNFVFQEESMRQVIHQLKEVASQLNVEILLTTSRRTSSRIEHLIVREFKKYSHCLLLVTPSRQDIPEALGGILGLSDILVVSADSISMISEAASSGKTTIVFTQNQDQKFSKKFSKHARFIQNLAEQTFILTTQPNQLARIIYDVAKDKVRSQTLNDQPTILKAIEKNFY